MSVKMLSSNDAGLVFEIHIPFETAMLSGEQCIEQVLNEVGAIASGELLSTCVILGGFAGLASHF